MDVIAEPPTFRHALAQAEGVPSIQTIAFFARDQDNPHVIAEQRCDHSVIFALRKQAVTFVNHDLAQDDMFATPDPRPGPRSPRNDEIVGQQQAFEKPGVRTALLFPQPADMHRRPQAGSLQTFGSGVFASHPAPSGFT
ncbi:hypothetical protein [Brevundimonas subvibrioides]|uniref:hypothetical protein n=1 Tax=Brevundimonas subvibrioides TaxID=74313 RepID=UPI0022B43BBA|nr:hypothetical protein [Brevundimonas subvibrioides]